MILDSAKVSLLDGSQKQSIEVLPGHSVLSFVNGKATRAQVLNRAIETKTDIIGLVLTNGQKLCGSPDQKVAVYRRKTLRYLALKEIFIGDHLLGERAGMRVVVGVTGLVFYPRNQARLISFELDRGKPFIAEGVLCR